MSTDPNLFDHQIEPIRDLIEEKKAILDARKVPTQMRGVLEEFIERMELLLKALELFQEIYLPESFGAEDSSTGFSYECDVEQTKEEDDEPLSDYNSEMEDEELRRP